MIPNTRSRYTRPIRAHPPEPAHLTDRQSRQTLVPPAPQDPPQAVREVPPGDAVCGRFAAVEPVPRQFLASARAREAGGRIVALTMPILTPMNMSLGAFCALNPIPGWGEILALPAPERVGGLRDARVRAELPRRADAKEAGVVFRRLADFGRYVIGATYSAANKGPKRASW